MVSRVLMSTEVVGNLWPLALDMGRALEDRGVEVVLVTVGRKLTNDQRREAWAISSLTLYEQPLRAEWMDTPWDDVRRVGERLLSLEQAYSPDVVHLHGYAHGALPFDAPVVLSCHNSIALWWQLAHGTPPPDEFQTYLERARLGLRQAQAVVAASSAMLHMLARLSGPITRPYVIPSGCDPRLFMPGTKEDLVLSATRSWDGSRNLLLVDQAAANVKWPWHAAADDTRPPEAGNRVERTTENVHLLGSLSRAELADWLSRASIYACPGSFDPTGLSVLEAALSGCALVLGDTEILREFWEGCAIFVDSRDPDELAHAVSSLAEDPEQRRALAHAARERALPFTVDASTDAHLALYQDLIDHRGRGEVAEPSRSNA